MKYIIRILLLMVAIHSLVQPHYRTRAKACVTDEGVTLRWALTDMQTWQAVLSNGYIVERFTIMKNGEMLSAEDIVHAQYVEQFIKKTLPLQLKHSIS